MPNSVLLYCRPGFEKDCMAEMTDLASQRAAFGWANLEMNSGFMLFETDSAQVVYEQVNKSVFARDGWPVFDRLTDLDPANRLTPILDSVEKIVAESKVREFGNVLCEYAEGDDYRATSRFAGKFVNPLRQALRKKGWLCAKEKTNLPALRLFFKDSSQVLVGVDNPDQRATWPMGIARLRFPPSAPSRSTLKLEEAFIHFLGASWREQLENCHTAVDLGASPGGWTWQLVNQQMNVYAVDNGPMDTQLMATGLVDHIAEDGFVWKPKKTVDWLVCDMIEKPTRVAQLMYEWLHGRHAKFAIFNLKLPMKKRFQQWSDIKEMLEIQLAEHHPKARFEAKHLYHDREEITVYLDLRNQNG